ncbi:hypothetical protein ACFQ08_35985, partial [Streptosporangium algeriense]
PAQPAHGLPYTDTGRIIAAAHLAETGQRWERCPVSEEALRLYRESARRSTATPACPSSEVTVLGV